MCNYNIKCNNNTSLLFKLYKKYRKIQKFTLRSLHKEISTRNANEKFDERRRVAKRGKDNVNFRSSSTKYRELLGGSHSVMVY